MGKSIFVVAICTAILACQSASVDKKDDGIKYKQSVVLNDVPKSMLTFFEVSDSRCPKDVQCVWAGNATVDLALEGVTTEGKITQHVNMCLGDCRMIYNTATYREIDTLEQEFAGQKYRFILEAVNPQAKVDSTRKKEDYSISLKIEKR